MATIRNRIEMEIAMLKSLQSLGAHSEDIKEITLGGLKFISDKVCEIPGLGNDEKTFFTDMIITAMYHGAIEENIGIDVYAYMAKEFNSGNFENRDVIEEALNYYDFSLAEDTWGRNDK